MVRLFLLTYKIMIKKKILLCLYYLMGIGPDGMTPRPGATIYIASDNSFYIPEELE